jgi:hypothetical protein
VVHVSNSSGPGFAVGEAECATRASTPSEGAKLSRDEHTQQERGIN